jgi:hypothetical protein
MQCHIPKHYHNRQPRLTSHPPSHLIHIQKHAKRQINNGIRCRLRRNTHDAVFKLITDDEVVQKMLMLLGNMQGAGVGTRLRESFRRLVGSRLPVR